MDEVELREEAYLVFGRLVARSDPGRFEAWAGLGLTMTQLRVLFLLREDDGLAAGALAERLDITPSTLTRLMDRIVQNRLVQREVDADDRRLVRHNLTKSGFEIIGEMERTFRSRMDRVFALLNEEQLDRLVLALRDLFAAYEAIEVSDGQKVKV